MAVTASKAKKKKPSRRYDFIIGGIVLVALMFAAGFLFGWKKPAPSTENVAATPNAGASQPKLASLSDLVAGLEAKVVADPKNIEQRVLLAQTYTELGQRDKGIAQLRAIHIEAPQNAEATIMLATALMDSKSQTELRESSQILDEAVRLNPAVMPMARLYQGDIQLKLGDAKGAIKIWSEYVKQMPAGDQRRTMFEEKIAQASAKK